MCHAFVDDFRHLLCHELLGDYINGNTIQAITTQVSVIDYIFSCCAQNICVEVSVNWHNAYVRIDQTMPFHFPPQFNIVHGSKLRKP